MREMRKLSAMEIQDKVNKEHLVPLQIKIERLLGSLTKNDKPSHRNPKGSYKYVSVNREVKKLLAKKEQINRALVKKVRDVSVGK